AAAALETGIITSPATATVLALASLGPRHAALTAEIATLDGQTGRLLSRFARPLVDRVGIGPDSASALLAAAGDNPGRLRGEAAFAALCGTSPVEGSSGKTARHRANRGGDRRAKGAV